MDVGLRPPFRESILQFIMNNNKHCTRYGASGIWVGTRFVASEEAGAPKKHKEQVLSAGYDDVVRTLVYSGRPMSVRKTPYVEEWFEPKNLLRYFILTALIKGN